MLSITTFVVTISAAMKHTFVVGYPLSQFYPFGSTVADKNLPGNDDGSTAGIPISVPFPFFWIIVQFCFCKYMYMFMYKDVTYIG